LILEYLDLILEYLDLILEYLTLILVYLISILVRTKFQGAKVLLFFKTTSFFAFFWILTYTRSGGMVL
jgi:hypothetical protein